MDSITLFGIPLFVWFGILTILSLFVTAFFGLNMGKYGITLTLHKRMAFLTVAFALLHLIFGAWQGIF